MIEIYLSITDALQQVTELQHTDIEGSEEMGNYPSAYVGVQNIAWGELGQGIMQGEATFAVRLKLKPYHRSAGDSPVLDSLKSSLNIVHDVRHTLKQWGDDYVQNVVIVSERLQRDKGGLYEVVMTCKCRVIDDDGTGLVVE